MHIIFLINSCYPNYTGGIENWLNNVSNRLASDTEVTIISHKQYDTKNKFGSYNNINSNIQLIRINTLKNIPVIKIFVRWYLGFLNLYFASFMTKRKLKHLLNNEKKYVLIALDSTFMAKVGMWFKTKYNNVKYISSVRCPHVELTLKNFPFLKYNLNVMEQHNLKNADAIWANGYDTQIMLKNKGFDSFVMKNGIDIKRTQNIIAEKEINLPLKGKFNIISIGTLLDIKGYVELIKAVGILNNEYCYDVNLVVLGKGNPQKYLKLASKLNIANKVHFVGERRDTIESAAHFDLAACLSGGSGLSMACLESMASKTPVIAWNTPVYRQLIKHKSNGYLVEEKNVEKLAIGIKWMIKHKSERIIFGREGYNTVKKYDWGIIIKDFYHELSKFGGK